MYACMWVCVDTLCTQVSICRCTRHAYRWVHVDQLPSIHLDIYVRMDVYVYLDTCTSERHRGALASARLCGCARGRARVGCICLRVQSPLRMHRCVYHARAGVCACLQCDVLWIRPFDPTSARCCAMGAAARARGARQAHL
jgi:hypothetical protein